MKIVSCFVDEGTSVKKDYILYEKVEEVDALGVKIVPVEHAQRGDYCRSDNGYYIPVIRRIEKRTAKAPECLFITLVFPRWQFRVTKYLDTGKMSRKTFSYPFEPRQVERTKLSAKMILVASMMAKGISPYDAMRVAYPSNKGFYREKRLKEMMDNDNFVNYIISRSEVKNLKEALNKEGVDYEYLAKHLKNEIESGGKTSFDAIKFGFNLVNASDTKTDVKEQIPVKSIGDSLMEKKLLESKKEIT